MSSRSKIQLVHDGGQASERGRGVLLTPSPQLDGFLAAAAGAGLGLEEGVRLGIERALALSDAKEIGCDTEAARQRLCAAAKSARPRLALASSEAERVRSLSAGRPAAAPAVPHRLVVPLPPRILARARGRVGCSALRAAVVSEMVSWEIAATLEGRTMGEWALRVLAAPKRRRRES